MEVDFWLNFLFLSKADNLIMSKNLILPALVISLLAGCASVPMESAEKTAEAKKFTAPSNGKSGVYIYRSGSFGAALKKDIWIDGKCIGETAPNIFFYEEVQGNSTYKVSTESEFSPNDLTFNAVAGKNHFIRQYIRIGVFVGGAGLDLVSDEEGKSDILPLEMAKKGVCSQ